MKECENLETQTYLFPAKWIEALRELRADIRNEVILAVFDYWEGKESEPLKPIAGIVFRMMKSDVDAMEAGKKRKKTVKSGSYASQNASAAPECVKKTLTNTHIKQLGGENGRSEAQKSGKKAQNSHNIIEYNIIENNIIEDKIKEKKSVCVNAHANFSEILEQTILEAEANPEYRAFLVFTRDNAPYLASHIRPLTEKEYLTLVETFGAEAVKVNLLKIENRVDLRSRYSNPYLSLLNWCKRDGNH